MDRQLKRILDLVRRTGDRMVVTDPNGHDAYVIMGLDQYEDLLTGAENSSCHNPECSDCCEDDFEDQDDLAWTPEMYGDLIPNDQDESMMPGENLGKTEPVSVPIPQEEALPEDLRSAVEHDLAILESWHREKEAQPESKPEQPKVTQDKEKNDQDEDRFYLEPIE